MKNPAKIQKRLLQNSHRTRKVSNKTVSIKSDKGRRNKAERGQSRIKQTKRAKRAKGRTAKSNKDNAKTTHMGP